MKKLFVETNAFNAVAFLDDHSKAIILDETEADYGEPLTLEVAKNHDFSNINMDGTADEARCDLGFGTLIFWDGTAEAIGADKVTEI